MSAVPSNPTPQTPPVTPNPASRTLNNPRNPAPRGSTAGYRIWLFLIVMLGLILGLLTFVTETSRKDPSPVLSKIETAAEKLDNTANKIAASADRIESSATAKQAPKPDPEPAESVANKVADEVAPIKDKVAKVDNDVASLRNDFAKFARTVTPTTTRKKTIICIDVVVVDPEVGNPLFPVFGKVKVSDVNRDNEGLITEFTDHDGGIHICGDVAVLTSAAPYCDGDAGAQKIGNIWGPDKNHPGHRKIIAGPINAKDVYRDKSGSVIYYKIGTDPETGRSNAVPAPRGSTFDTGRTVYPN